VIVEGVVIAKPDVRDTYTNLRVEADKLIITDRPTRTVHGLVLVVAPPFSDYRYGDQLRIEGKLQTSTDSDFSYRDYLARQGVYSTPHTCGGFRCHVAPARDARSRLCSLCVAIRVQGPREKRHRADARRPRTAGFTSHRHFVER